MKIKYFVIDPGHGGKFSGAVYNGQKESMLNYKFAHRIMNKLKDEGHRAILTRDSDKELGKTLNADLSKRSDLANENKADLFVSIHCNASTNPDARGFEVWTSKGETKSDKIADNIIKQISEEIPEIKIRKDLSDGDNDHEADFSVLRKTKMPAVLVEIGFMSNEKDLTMMNDYLYLEKISKAIVNGVLA